VPERSSGKKRQHTPGRPNITRAKVENRFSRYTGFHRPVITVTKAVTVTKTGKTPPRALARELNAATIGSIENTLEIYVCLQKLSWKRNNLS
jgi:hypothetical protein